MRASKVVTVTQVWSSQMNAVRVVSLTSFPLLTKLRSLKGCGNGINPTGKQLDQQTCNVMACSGNSLQYCGKNQAMIIYSRD